MNQPRLDPAAEGAIDWMVRLSAGNTDATLQAQFDQWLASDPSHAQAWKRLQDRLGGACQTVRSLDRRAPGQAGEARRVLLQPTTTRRDLLRSVAAIGVLGGGLWLGARSQMGEALLADLRTGRGERRSFNLADGSRLSLNAGSAVDLQFDVQQRLLILRQGELVIQVASDPRRPLRVRTAQGDVRALGTRFLVSQEDGATRLVVLEHSVRASLFDGTGQDVQEGQAALLLPQRIEALGNDEVHRADWLNGRLNVLDDSLDAVVEALRPYYRGFVRVEPEVRGLRVQGVFPLDEPQRAFAALAETLPVRIEHYSPWLTLIRAKDPS
ncbi:FecR family protein [Pseudomonas sp. JQ170]|uniref:FecR domain-containing protein n=1 Tax=unclassified Pseudomonas TaxID=196821 RepID=UPI00264EAF35|nr:MULTISPECIES: FecR family protein [unclassified Pseudomonas]MDN7142090.1 FecR family protein [Pseudomonas sp. JQ170]WRO78030.1 FecR family protein [Pseudomonas sp. 170C]